MTAPLPPDNRKLTGNRGEQFAADHLRSQGYEIVAVNVRPLPGMARGELDIVAYDGPTLCFIEVKTRRSRSADAAESVTPAKRRQLIMLAEAYLGVNSVPDTIACRFDVVTVNEAANGGVRVELWRDAFSPE